MGDWLERRAEEGIKDKVWEITIDTGEPMLTCPKCGCRMIKKWYDLAVGSRGYNYCPYCGKDMRKDGQLSIRDFLGR